MSAAVRVESFAPVWRPDCRVLVLGSSPGVRSVQAGCYYAHPRNAFWPIMAHLLGFAVELEYSQRLQCLLQGGIALWDVARVCERPGSLDARIRQQSVEPNAIEALLARLPQLTAIAFNGATAERLYRRHFTSPEAVALVTLPSTSPANARLALEQKLACWAQLQAYL